MSEVREDAVEKAARLGMDLVIPKPDEIFVDLDCEDARCIFESRLVIFCKLWDGVSYCITPSSSPGHYHAIVTVPELAPLSDHERIALQAALGSDCFREMLAIFHGRAGYQYTLVFFEKKGTDHE